MEQKIQPSYSMWQNIKYIIRNMWKWNKKLLIISVMRIPPLVIMPFLTILMPKIVIDCLTKKVNPEVFVLYVGLVTLGIILCNAINEYLKSWGTWNSVSYRFKYINSINEKCIDMDYENLESPEGQKRSAKAEQAVGSNDTGTEAIVNGLVLIATDLVGFVLYGSILSKLNPLVVIILLATSLISYFSSRIAQNYEHRNKDNWAFLNRKISYLMEKCADYKSGKDIRIYGMGSWFMNIFDILLYDRLKWLKRVEVHNYFSNITDGILIFIRDGLAYAYLIYLVLSRMISVADFTLYFGAVAGLSAWISGITDQIIQINHMSLEICDLRDYLEFPDKFNRGTGEALPSADEMPCTIEFENVSFKYDKTDKTVLNDFSLKIKKGEKIALVGVNGAGKTTIVKLLCGFYHPTSGSILINGKNMCKYNRDEYYKLFTVVFQDIHVLPVSIARNIAPGNNDPIDNKKVQNCLRLAGLDEKVNGLPNGIESPMIKEVNDDAVQFSGGELQKLLLARAIYKEAPILILDEPTAALDPIAENELYKRYGELTEGRTSIFISHRLSSTRFCDRIIFLSEGRIAESGTHEELMNKNGMYAKMYEIQSHYYKDSEGIGLAGDINGEY